MGRTFATERFQSIFKGLCRRLFSRRQRKSKFERKREEEERDGVDLEPVLIEPLSTPQRAEPETSQTAKQVTARISHTYKSEPVQIVEEVQSLESDDLDTVVEDDVEKCSNNEGENEDISSSTDEKMTKFKDKTTEPLSIHKSDNQNENQWDLIMSETWEHESARERVQKCARRIREMYRSSDIKYVAILFKELLQHCRTAYGEVVSQIVSEKLIRKIDERDHHGDTALHRAIYAAASKGQSRSIAIGRLRLLCDIGASPNAVNSYGDTALHVVAAQSGPTEAIIVLLEAGASPEIHNAQGYTPLLVAAREAAQDARSLFEALAATTIDPNYTCPYDGMNPLHHACVNDMPHTVDILIRVAQCDVNMRTIPHGHTPLMKTCIYAAHRCLERLLRSQPQEELDIQALELDLKASDSGMTALHFAARAGDSISMSLLLAAAGANPQIRDHASKLPILYAAHAQSPACVESIRAHPSMPVDFDITPLGRRVQRLLEGGKNEDDQLGGSTCFNKYGGCF